MMDVAGSPARATQVREGDACRRPSTCGARGLTLIGLLVVIGIIAILAAIVFPVFMSAKKRAHLSVCASNLKQVGLQTQTGTANPIELVCPRPRPGSDGRYIKIARNFGEDLNVVCWAFCVQHLEPGENAAFKVPLEGQFVVLLGASSTRIVDARGVKRYRKVGQQWVETPEDGTIPDGESTRWRFPAENWPPEP